MKSNAVTDDDLGLLQQMRGAPISYLANRPPVEVAAGGSSYPLGSGLSHQVQYDKHLAEQYVYNQNDIPQRI